MTRIDAHQHFWQVSRGDYEWLTPELSTLYRDFLPENLAPILTNCSVSKTVLVQAAETVAETEFMLSLANNNDFIAGVVGWVDMESDDAVQQLTTLKQDPYFKGIRPMIQDIEDPNWMLKPDLAPVFEALIEFNLTFDALVKPQHLTALHTLLQRYPTLKVVVDHGAKPDIASGDTAKWLADLSMIAKQTSAFCKLSGLITEAGDSPEYSQVFSYMTSLLELFGAERLMWGSDWPVIELAKDYPSWIAAVEAFVAPLTPAQQQAIWANTAAAFYSIK